MSFFIKFKINNSVKYTITDSTIYFSEMADFISQKILYKSVWSGSVKTKIFRKKFDSKNNDSMISKAIFKIKPQQTRVLRIF